MLKHLLLCNKCIFQQEQNKISAVHVLKTVFFFFLLLSNTFSRGPLKQQRSLAQSSQTLSVSHWTLFGNWQSVQRNRLGIEHPGKFHFTSEVVYLWKIIWFGVSKQRGLHRSQWLMCESWGLQPIRKSWSRLEKAMPREMNATPGAAFQRAS